MFNLRTCDLRTSWTIGSSTRSQIGALYRQLKEYIERNLKGLPHRGERAACFAVLLVLLFSVAAVLRRPTVQESADTTPVNGRFVAATWPVHRPPFLVGPSVPLRKHGSTVRTFVAEGYGPSSLAFEANQGQTDPRVKFLSRGVGFALFFTANEAVVVLRRPTVDHGQYSAERDAGFTTGTPTLDIQGRTAESPTPNPAPDAQTFDVMRMRFVGANTEAHLAGSEPLPGKVNYFIGNDPKQWRSDIPTYARVRYQDVYPGVSVVYYGTPGQLEYDLVIDPGVDPKVIVLDCEGANKVKIDAQGNLRLLIPGGEVLLGKPRIYQMPTGGPARWRGIAGGYVLKGGGHVGFQVGEYDRKQPLIVDPVLSYSTYLGGSGYDSGAAIAVDASGNAYVTGFTRSPNFPATAGSFQTSCGTTGTCNGYFWDAFITKLTANGLVVYSSFLGGSGNDMGKAIAVDASGAAYVTGQTFSNNFPTTAGAFKTTNSGVGDAFVAKVSPGGTALQYSTYLGGSGTDNAEGIAVDGNGNAYVTGQTYSTDFPTAAPIQASNGGNQDSDAFVTEINSSGSALVYSTYLGGGNLDWGQAIAVDLAGNAYVTGATKSPDFPLANPLQAICGGCPGSADAFVAEISPNGGALLRATYLGGSSTDHGYDIAVDITGDIYVTGFTYSSDFPTTQGAYQTSLGPGGASAFVTKIAPNFSGLVYSTYLHGNGLDFGKTIAVDTGNVFVGGQTYSSSFPLTNAIQGTCNSSNCYYGTGFISEFNAAGSGLVFSTYLGGSYVDQISSIALDSSANAYLAGEAGSSNFPTANAVQATFGGSYADAFATQIALAPAVSLSPTSLSFGNQPVGTTSGSQTILLTSYGTAPVHIASIAASVDFAQTNDCGNGVAAGSTCTIYVTFTPTTTGTRAGTLTITENASGSPQTASLTGAAGAPTITTQPASQTVTLGQTATFNVTATGTNPLSYQWQKNSTNIDQATSSSYTTPATTSADNGSRFTVLVSNSVGSVTSNAATLTVSTPPSITTQPASQTVTAGQTATFTVAVIGTNPLSYQWQKNSTNITGATSSNCTTPATTTADNNSTFDVVVTNGAGSVTSNAATLTVNPAPTSPAANPASLTFTSQMVGTTSPAQTATLSNNGGTSLSITSVSVTGANAGDFAQTSTCGTSLAAGGNCTVSVVFSPTASGTRTASVSIADNAVNSPQNIPLSGTGLTSGCTKFVSPSGSDSNSGSLSSPWQHLQVAFNGSVAGDVVCLRAGTYPSQSNTTYSQVMNKSGTAGNPITIQAFPGEVVVVQGNTRVNGAFITFKGTAMTPPYALVFQIGTAGLAINGIDVLNTHDVTLDHVEIANFDYHAAYNQSNGCNNQVLGSYIHDNGITTGVSGISWGSTTTGCTNGGLIANNVVENNGTGIGLYSGGSKTIPANVTVEENTFVDNAGYGIVVWGDNNIVANNVAYGNGDHLNDPQGTIHTGVANVVDHNVTFSPTSTSRWGWYLAGGCCLTNNLAQDPLFVSAPTKNWHLTPSSPAISFSNTNYVEPVDKDGVTRGPSYDAGAYQFVSVSLSPNSLTFASQSVNTTSTPQTVNLTNSGNATLSITSISITSTNAGDFAQSNTCGTSVAGGGSCAISVTFTPTATGARTGTLAITDKASGSPQTISLTGSGQ